jgi:hypothetical protein
MSNTITFIYINHYKNLKQTIELLQRVSANERTIKNDRLKQYTQ